jgi:hypothetical protein
MIVNRHLMLCAALSGLALASTACSKKNTTIQDAGSDAGLACLSNADCPDPVLFYCNATTGQCDPSCHQQSDCSASVRGPYAISYCDTNLGCQCDDGLCVAALCSADSDCGSGMVCRNGACVTSPASSTVASCQLTPDVAATTVGATVSFQVSLWDSAGNPVVLPSGISWSAVTSALTVSGTPGGSTATFTAASASTTSGVQAQAGSATCQATVAIYDPTTVAAGSIEVIVTDELSGRPVSGAVVVASDPASGVISSTAQPTGLDGLATVSAAATVNVTAFHTDYSYLTIANYNPAATGASRFLSVVLRRNPQDKIGGYAGTFNDLPTTPQILAGIAGMSIAGTITDLDINQILGNSVPTLVNIPNLINNEVEDLPQGVFLQFESMAIKSNDAANGLAGVCTDAFAGGTGQAGPLILSGGCGTRAAWGLAANLALGDIEPIISAVQGGVGGIDYGTVLSGLIPVFNKFNSSVGRDVQFTLSAPSPDGGTGGYTAFDNDFQQIPLAFQYVAQLPPLVEFNGTYPDGVLALALVDAPGRGLVPLGLGAGINTSPQDDEVDPQTVGPYTTQPGQLFIRQAPTHQGLEGDTYALALLSLSLKTVGSTGLVTSALIGRLPGNKLLFDPAGATPVVVSGPFLDLPFGMKCNFTTSAQPGLPARTCTFATLPSLTGVNVLRFGFTNSAGRRWNVIADPAAAAAGSGLFALPQPPNNPQTSAPFEDRMLANPSGGVAQRSDLLAQMLMLNSAPAGGGDAVSFMSLVQLGSTNADHLNEFTTGFSVVDYGHPGIKWTTPSANGATLTHGSTVTLTVSHFNVGTSPSSDGIVVLSFSGTPAGCATTVAQGTSADSSGNVTIIVPSTCEGTNIAVTATLYDNESTPVPINPPVSAALTGVTIN